MNVKYFLDTNVLVYCFDKDSIAKQSRAKKLVRSALVTGDGIISYQVVQEFLNVSTRKFAQPMSASDASNYLNQVLMPLCHTYPSRDLYDKALTVMERYQLSFYDSLIVGAAMESGCQTLYSEYLQAGLKIEKLTIKNPFMK